jgi:CelD/BcsL family acetyltransferase involved in cellulose biosynthesis
VLKDTYDFDIQALVVLDDADSAAAEPRAGIAFASIDDMMDPRIVSLPFSDFCDPLVQDQGDWDAVVGRLLANEHRLSLRCLHNQIPLDDERLTQANRAKWHAVDLRRDVDDIWQDLHGSARRAIRKARRNVTVRRAQHKGDLRAFFELHLGLRKYKYELLAQPYRFFEHIWDHFIAKDKGALMLAVHESHIIAGVLFLEWQDKLYYKFNASAPESVSLRPNDLIVWEGIKYGQRKGYEYLDFGLSDWDQEGLLRYKRKFATEEKTISFLTYTPGGSPSQEERQMRALLPQITDLFVDETVPDCITERAGEVLYRFFT